MLPLCIVDLPRVQRDTLQVLRDLYATLQVADSETRDYAIVRAAVRDCLITVKEGEAIIKSINPYDYLFSF